MENSGYWDKFWRRRASRRTLLRSGVLGTAGLAAAIALGCENEEKKPTTPEATPMAAATLEPEYANAKRGGVRNVDLEVDPDHFDLHNYLEPALWQAAAMSYNLLMRGWERSEEPGQFAKVLVAPELASKWEQVDQTTYRFSLVQNAKWHNLPPVNGRQFTSADVKYSFERMIDPKYLESVVRSSVDAIDRIETPDNFTAVFKMKYPFAGFLTNVRHNWNIIVPPELGDDQIKEKMVGTGPFIYKGRQRGVRIEFERNPEYFRTGHPFIEKVVMRYQPDRATRLANFRTGETDSYGGIPPSVPLEQIEDLQKSLGDKVTKFEYKAGASATIRMIYDTTSQPFKDIRLRHAFLYGIPYDTIIGFLGGYASRSGPLPPGNREWALKPEELPAPDVEKAKALLAEAGYGPNNPLKVTSKIALYGGQTTSLLVQAMVKPLGIEITIEPMDAGDWVAKVYSGKEPYHLTAHFDATFDDPDRRLYSYYHSKGGQNQTHYVNPEVDKLLEAQRKEFDTAKRKELVRQVQVQLVKDAPEVWLVSPGGRNLERTWLHNRHLMLYYPITDRQYDNVWYDPIPPGRT